DLHVGHAHRRQPVLAHGLVHQGAQFAAQLRGDAVGSMEGFGRHVLVPCRAWPGLALRALPATADHRWRSGNGGTAARAVPSSRAPATPSWPPAPRRSQRAPDPDAPQALDLVARLDVGALPDADAAPRAVAPSLHGPDRTS